MCSLWPSFIQISCEKKYKGKGKGKGKGKAADKAAYTYHCRVTEFEKRKYRTKEEELRQKLIRLDKQAELDGEFGNDSESAQKRQRIKKEQRTRCSLFRYAIMFVTFTLFCVILFLLSLMHLLLRAHQGVAEPIQVGRDRPT